MADLVTLTDAAFMVGLLTAVVGFYARFIRPSVVSTLTWRKDLESEVRAQRKDFESKAREIEQRLERVIRELEMRFERHSEAPRGTAGRRAGDGQGHQRDGQRHQRDQDEDRRARRTVAAVEHVVDA